MHDDGWGAAMGGNMLDLMPQVNVLFCIISELIGYLVHCKIVSLMPGVEMYA